MKTGQLLSILLLSALVLGACSRATPTPTMMESGSPTAMMADTPEAMMADTPGAMMESPTPEAMMGPAEDMHATATTPAMTAYGEDMPGTPTPEAMMGGESGMMSAPAWFTATLTTATSAESFTIHDYQGKVVLVEMMAVWCTTCFQQQQQIAELHKLLGMQDDLVTVSLDIDPNEDKAVLKNYVQKNGFDWAFAVASKDVAREIGQLYGDQFLNPPSAPMLIIDRHGEAHPLPFGVKSAADLQKALEMYLKAGM